MRSLLLATAALSVLATPSAWADAGAPYPQSDLGITWHPDTYRDGGLGGDIWPVTTGADGQLHTAWGDGSIGCGRYVSYGTATLPAAPAAVPRATGCGTPGSGKGKIASLLAAGHALYGVTFLQKGPWPRGGFAVWRSTDDGRTWQKPAATFSGHGLLPMNFVQFGPGNAGAPGGDAYLTAIKPGTADPKAFYLMRAPVAGLENPGAYQYLSGAGAWSGNPAAARPVFADPKGVNGPVVTYDKGLGRYLLTVGHGANAGHLGVFEGPSPAGPWRTVDYQDRWLGMRDGDYLGVQLPTKWMSADGKTLWAVFNGGASDRYHDRLNIMQATLAAAARNTAAAGARDPAQARRAQALAALDARGVRVAAPEIMRARARPSAALDLRSPRRRR